MPKTRNLPKAPGSDPDDDSLSAVFRDWKVHKAKRKVVNLDVWHLRAMPILIPMGIKQHTPYHFSLKLQASNINRHGPVYYDYVQIYPSTLKFVWKGVTCDLDINKFLKFCLKRLPVESERDKPQP